MFKQKGFTLVEGLLIVLILSVVGFAGYTVWNNQQDDESEKTVIKAQEPEIKSNQEIVSNTIETNKYSSSDFGFTIYYPNNINATEVKIYDGYENTGKTMNFTIDDDVYVISNTSDYNIGPKGPVPLSSILANGYVEKNNNLYFLDGESELSADSIEQRTNYLYIENTILFQGEDKPVEHIALFNTSKGGLVIYTENPDKIKIVEEIARTVSID